MSSFVREELRKSIIPSARNFISVQETSDADAREEFFGEGRFTRAVATSDDAGVWCRHSLNSSVCPARLVLAC